MTIALRFNATLLIVTLLATASASAEPIQIIGGTLTTTTSPAPEFRAQYSLILADGSLVGQWPGGTVFAISCISGCVTGTSVSPGARWFSPVQPSVLVPPPTGTLHVGDLTAGPYFSGLLLFGGDAFVLPPLVPGSASTGELTVSQSFSFTGWVTGYPALITGPFPIDPQFTVDLWGGGTAHLRFVFETLPSGTTLYRYRGTDYEFAPVPEPASLITVATGLGLLWSRSRRRARPD